MDRFLPLVIFALLGTTPVTASSTDDVTAQISKCLHVPPDAPESYRFVLRLQVIEGNVKLAAVDFLENRAPSEWEMAAMEMIADAATDCQPYGKLSYTFRILVDEQLVKQAAK